MSAASPSCWLVQAAIMDVGIPQPDQCEDGRTHELVCPDGVTRYSALDHPLYPELIAARARRSP